MAVGRDRLKRIASHAEQHGAVVLLENLNKEPDDAEIHYLAHTVEEWRYYFDAIQSHPPPHPITVYASHPPSPTTAQHSLPGLTGAGLSPAGSRQLRLTHRNPKFESSSLQRRVCLARRREASVAQLSATAGAKRTQ